MASGGPPSSRQAMSEPRNRSRQYRVSNPDAEDPRSIGSGARMEDRPNNWDFFDWQPSSLQIDALLGPRRETKKGNQEREQEKEQNDLDRGQSLSQDSTPQDPIKYRQKTPSTFPRVAVASRGQRRAIENIRQRMTFSDAEEVSSDGGKNNERYVPPRKKDRLPNFTLQPGSLERNVVGSSSNNDVPRVRCVEGASLRDVKNSHLNVNKDGPDSNQIVGRLMQIRDYIKQTTSMMNRVDGSADTGDQYRSFQLLQVITRLREQEQQYLELLLKYSKSKESHLRLSSLIESLKEQEKGFLNLLQKVLADREEELLLRQNSTESANSKQGTDSEATSELDVQTDSTAETEEDEQDEEEVVMEIEPRSGNRRPMIEDRLGRHSDTEQEDQGLPSAQSGRSPGAGGLDTTLTAEQEEDEDELTPVVADLAGHRMRLESDLATKNEELQNLREHHLLLQQMLQQQEELRALQNRQTALLALQKEAETNLAAEKAAASEGGYQNGPVQYSADNPPALSEPVAAAAAAGPQPDSVDGDENVPQELRELRQRLNYLKNIYDLKTQGSVSQSDDVQSANEESERSELSTERHQLQHKLTDLQDKKQQMDHLLQELQTLRDQKMRSIVAGADGDQGSMTSSQAHFTEGLMRTVSAEQTAGEAHEMLEMMEARRKMKKLQDVKERLNQLKDLVQYYQMSSDFIHGEPDGATGTTSTDATQGTTADDQEDASSMPLYSDYEDPQLMQNLRDLSKTGLESLLDRHQSQKSEAEAARKALQQLTQASEALTQQSDASETMSQNSSSYGAWGDDPDIQEKVRRLKAAKEKLRRLQELVAMVQHTPEAIHSLPEDLADLAASLEDGDATSLTSLTQQVSTAAREAAARSSKEPSPKGTSKPGAQDSGRHPGGGMAVQSASETNVDPREEFFQSKIHQQQSELDNLLQERNKLLNIQQELQRLHDALITEEQMDGGQRLSDDPRQQAQDDDSVNKDQQGLGTEVKSVPDTVQVTFGEPLETVISNEELYGQMRQQRILREELREKKKELEKYMKKDRPKKHYFRNQDNQSDNVSYSNKSDQYGASASEDVTMATWGGSTAGNLESIEEDGSGEGQGMEGVDDGYPSDGIAQVEEEEEAHDDSDDRDTYTIEEEFSPKHRRAQPPTIEGENGRGARAKQPKGAPFQGNRYNAQYSFNHWAPDNNQVLNNIRSPSHRKSQQKSKRRRKGESSALEDEVSSLRDQVHMLTSFLPGSGVSMRESQPLHLSQPAEALGSPSFVNPYSSQAFQQQQQMMNMQHNYSQLLLQQQEMTERFSRLEQWLMVGPTAGRNTSEPHHRADRHAPSRSPATSKQMSAQDSARLDSLLTPPDREQFELNPRGFSSSSQYLNHGSYNSGLGEIGAQEARAQASAIIDSYTNDNLHTRVGGQMSYNIPPREGSSPGQARTSRLFNPFQQPQLLSTGLYPGQITIPLDRSPDSIPIDTIHAANEQAIQAYDMAKEDRKTKVKRKISSKKSPNRYRNKHSSSRDHDEVVIARRFPTPSRASAAARLAEQQVPPRVPSMDPRHTAADGGCYPDQASVSSALSSVPGGDLYPYNITKETSTRHDTRDAANGTSDAPTALNTFEALRETIYAEVATLISQNEKRPHYLIELFRELQMLGSDYLRQRALYAVQDLVAKHLTESDIRTSNNHVPPAEWTESPLAPAAEELTPSESMVSIDDDEPKVLRGIVTVGDQDSMHSDRFDYVENVETTSSMSTPTSAGSNQENPFAQDSLGDTVIHLEKALRKMKEYELKLAECDNSDYPGASPETVTQAAGVSKEPASQGDEDTPDSVAMASGPPEHASDGSFSDIPESTTDSSASDISYPHIDTQQLDQQIKNIMKEIIPVLKEHMDDVCSQQLLQYIKRLVLLLTKQRDEEQEFVRFFHSQLSTSLQDSLAKFEGRKLRDCGEDLLVDLSEILFNELAFFRLMQDLDDPKAKVKARIRQWRHDSQTSTETPVTQEDVGGDKDKSSSSSSDDDSGDEADSSNDESESDESERDTEGEAAQLQQPGDNPDEAQENEEPVINSEEQEDLGKDRDDAFAARVDIGEQTKINDKPLTSPMKIELAPSETKPFTRIGSDEDDEAEDDEAASCEDPSETAVSRDAEKDRTSSTSSAGQDTDDSVKDGSVHDDDEEATKPETSSPAAEAEPAQAASPCNGQLNGDVLTENTAPQVNGEVPESEGEQVTIDDLPKKLNTLSKEELESKMEEEEKQNDLAGALLESLKAEGDAVLAGDPECLKEPTSAPCEPATRKL